MAYHPEDNAAICATCGREQEPGARFCPNCGASSPGGGPGYAAGMPYPPGGGFAGGVEYMGFWIRVAAALIDAILISIVALLVGWVLRSLLGFALGGTASNLVGLAVGWIYHVAFITVKGQTIGKMIVGVQVVNQEGSIPGLGSVLLLEIVGKFLSGIAFLLGYLWVGWDKEKRGWHDHIGRTYAVRKRRG